MRGKPDLRCGPGWKTLVAGAVVLGCALVSLSGSAGAQDAKAEALVDKVIAVHGGMESWRTLRDMTFTLTVIPFNPQEEVAGARVSLYRLKREGKARVETVTGRGLLVEGFDGERPWVVLDGKPDSGQEALKRAHFQSVNWWYWMGIPYKLKDPGVILRHTGTGAVGSRSVEVLDVTFRPGVGHTNDHFVYYIDPETAQMLFVDVQLQSGVWPGVGSPSPSRSARFDYKREGPFMMHTKWITYTSPQMTQRRAIILFRDFQFNTGLPDSLFTGP